jgi:hypothetical protein
MTSTMLPVTPVQPSRAGRLVRGLLRHRRWLWLVPAVPGAVLAVLIMVVLPPDRTLDDLAEWAFRLSPFLLAVMAVSLLPRGRFSPAVIVLAAVIYMSYIDTAFVLRILDYGQDRAEGVSGTFQLVYQFQLVVVTYTALFGLLAFRLGGARTVTVLKTGIAAVLIVISGLNDLTFWAFYEWPQGRPAELDWASHITVFVGGPPSVATAVVFMAVHVALAGVILALPLGRWLDRTLQQEVNR